MLSDPQGLYFLFVWLVLLLERGEAKEKERKRNVDVQEIHGLVACHKLPTGDLARNPSMSLDWELN